MGTVGIASGRERHFLALFIMLAGVLLALRPFVFGLDPNLDVSQYAHTAWKIRDGFARGEILSIAQTTDGYLWFGTEFGLFRFDGVRNDPWLPPRDQHLPSSFITSLLAARDGTLWIGTLKGLASWKDGKLTQYPDLADMDVVRLFEDREGTVWAGVLSFPPPGRLCAIQKSRVTCYGDDGSLGNGVVGLYEDSKGNLWAGVHAGLWRWKPGPRRFYSLAREPNGIRALGEGADGTLLVGWNGGIYRFADGKTEPYPLQGNLGHFEALAILRDHAGGLWIGTHTQGLVHVHQERTDVFSRSDGLSGEDVYHLFEDREGNVWVATNGGLDRFRDFAVTTFSSNQGLSNSGVTSVLADLDGSVWIATLGGLNRWRNGRITTYDKRDGKLGGLAPDSLFQDDRGRIWVSTNREFGYLENNRFIPVSGIPGGVVHGIAEDTAKNLWVANQDRGLIRLSSHGEVQQIPWASLGHKDHASAIAADPSRSGLWLGFFNGGVVYFADGQVRASYTAADGLGDGRVAHFRFDPDGTVWAATQSGLSRLKNGRIATLTTNNGLPCDGVHWVIQDNDHSFWRYTPCGLVRIMHSELDAWASEVDKDKNTKRKIQLTVFDILDGVRSTATAHGYTPQVTRSTDGKLWFATMDGVSVIDPRHLPFNKLPPPVHIEEIIADHKSYPVSSDENGNVPLPALVRDLQIDYTALSLVAPEKVLFRYKLEGWDRDWQDVGTRRQAFYSNLPPRNYTFRVKACNNSGVWNEAGTSLNFFVAPAYYQTWWFRSLCVAGFLGLLAVLYRLRLRQLSRQFNMRLEARVAERTRIARDLHDTLLQSFQGVLLKLHAVTYMLGDRPEAQKRLGTVIDQARQAITEGRDAVQGMRSSTLVGNDLARTLSMLGEDLAAEHGKEKGTQFCVQVQGTTRELAPLVRDDVYRIACEALRNAFRHAHAARIEVEIQYDPRQLRLRVRDNGKGIDPKFLEGGGRAGHYGLPGMHERVKLVGGKLAIWSELGSGTETELTVPSSIAYAKATVTRRFP